VSKVDRLFDDPQQLIRRVYAYVATQIGAGADSEDVTSNVIERALRYRDSFDPARGTAGAWLIGIARREIAEHLRARTLTTEPPEVQVPDPADDTVGRLAAWAAVARLDESDRELIALRYAADLTAREIAELLGRRTNAVEVALHRALRRLEAQITGLTRKASGFDLQPMSASFVTRAPSRDSVPEPLTSVRLHAAAVVWDQPESAIS
jgi:RNA polymerase sigma factor (sigma-70 family)